jgi:hypothetical protein
LQEIDAAKVKIPSMMDSIADALKQAGAIGLSTSEVRKYLEQSGFDLSLYAQPTATIATSLFRLAAQKKVTRAKDGKAVWANKEEWEAR